MRNRFRSVFRVRFMALPLAGLAAVVAFTTPGGALAVRSGRSLVPNTLSPYAGRLPALGSASPTAPARALISLQHRHQAALVRFVAEVSNPASARYEHYLTPNQFVARYAPRSTTVSAVEAFAHHYGLRVAGVPSNRAYVYVTGTVAGMERAFQTTIDRFSLRGHAIEAPTRELSIPTSLAGVITGVTGLDTGDVAQPMIGPTPPAPAYVNAPPQSTYFGEKAATQAPGAYGRKVLPDVARGYTPQQLEGAYGVAGLIRHHIDGRGQTVAVIDAYSSPTIAHDAAEWSSSHRLPAPQLKLIDTAAERDTPEPPGAAGGLLDPQGWFGEETLDVEAVHAMAPRARIVVQSAASPVTLDLERAQNNVVAHHLAQILSNSYGGSTDSTNSTSDGYWQQAAAEGMGVYFSAGDSGDQTAGGTTPASRAVGSGPNSPYVTAVGGTTLAVGPRQSYNFETYWGTDTAPLSGGKWGANTWDYGGGGGTSEVYREPSYQASVVPSRFSDYWKGNPNAMSGAILPGRVVPDVAMDGDPNTGLLIGLTEDFTAYKNPQGADLPGDTDRFGQYRLGGTSLSSPLFAGIMALADQAAGKPHGFANPALYRLHGTRAFHDVVEPKTKVAVVRTDFTNATNRTGGTTVSLRTEGVLGTLSSVPGYDDSTGLGTPDGLAFIKGLAPRSRSLRAALR